MRGSLVPIGVLACLAVLVSCGSPSTQPLALRPVAAATSVPTAVPSPAPRPISLTVFGAAHALVFARDFPDPSVITVGDRYFAFGTHTAWETPGRLFPILSSTDLTHWNYVADAFSAAPSWGVGDWWAPAVIARGGEYFLYYSGRSPAGMHCLAVATSSAPAGPYADHGPIACQDGSAAIGYIDAWPLIAGGTAYLYFSVDGPNHHSISVMQLSSDMLKVAGPRVELLDVTQDWERLGFATVEGPSVFAWGSRYVMLYSGGAWRGQYGMGFAVAPSPTGPFTKSDVPLLRSGDGLAGPGGGSFFRDVHGSPWMAYHAWVGSSGRELYVSPLLIL